ncbi:hypothetical protein [Streptomyces erythrochromogenes]|uniref:hypothetical protein n=1 Tax=Streptomyces erythrochromogenes TaxID=285574 RepID=UPI0036C86925
MALYYRAKAHHGLGQNDASRDGMRQVADGGGRLAPAAARGLAHLARATGDFPTALATARTIGWPGRGEPGPWRHPLRPWLHEPGRHP